MDDEDESEKVKGLLIMSHERTRPITDRQAITEKQINIAKRNGLLIIDTIGLLKTYELYCNNEITRNEIVERISEEVGLYSINKLISNTNVEEVKDKHIE